MAVKKFKGISKKSDCQRRNTKRIIEVKEQIWLTDVEYLMLSTKHFIGILYLCSFQHYWHIYRKQNLSAKQGMQKRSMMIKNVVVKYIVYMFITAQLNPSDLLLFKQQSKQSRCLKNRIHCSAKIYVM